MDENCRTCGAKLIKIDEKTFGCPYCEVKYVISEDRRHFWDVKLPYGEWILKMTKLAFSLIVGAIAIGVVVLFTF